MEFETKVRDIEFYSNKYYTSAIDVKRESELALLQATVLNQTILIKKNQNIEERTKLDRYFEMTKELAESHDKTTYLLEEIKESNVYVEKKQSDISDILSIIEKNITQINEENKEVNDKIQTEKRNHTNSIHNQINFDSFFKTINGSNIVKLVFILVENQISYNLVYQYFDRSFT